MAFVGAAPGPASDVGEVVQTCAQSVYWTIQIKNGNLDGTPNIANAAVKVNPAGAGEVTVTTDGNGFVTLVFDPNEDLSETDVSVAHGANKWVGTAAGAAITVVDQYHNQSNVALKGTWKLVIRVNEVTPSARTAMKNAPITLTTAGVPDNTLRTKPGGGAYQNEALVCQTAYIVSVPDVPGANPVTSTAEVKVNTAPVDVATADVAVTRDGVTITRTAANEIQVNAVPHGSLVVIDFLLRFNWQVSITVIDAAAEGTPALATAPLVLVQPAATINAATGADAAAYVNAQMQQGVAYTINVPPVYANPALSTAIVEVNDQAQDVSTADTERVQDGVTVSRGADNKIKVKSDRGGARVKIAFQARMVWKLRVFVRDGTKKADNTTFIQGTPVNLCAASVRIVSPTATTDVVTAADGAAYAKDDMAKATAYQISAPEAWGELLATREAVAKVNGIAVDIATATTPAVRDNVTVVRAADNVVTVTVASGCPEVEVSFLLKFPKVFIVGEGPAFPYAVQLAKRYATGEPAAVRNLGARAVGTARATPLSDTRKWILASQYDIHAPPTVGLPKNFFVYRHNANNGRFDVRDDACWTRLTAEYGEVDAMVFNNPHPGYGLHKCDVFGIRNDNIGAAGKYISVHSLGWGPTLSTILVARFRTYGNIVQNHHGVYVEGGHPTYNMHTAFNQQYFLQTDVGCVRTGADSVSDFADDGSVTARSIGTSFAALAADDIVFRDRYTHYQETRTTIGLWASVLRCYGLNGVAALKSGGTMYIHGSHNFASALGVGEPLEGFALIGTWSDNTDAPAHIYYANYTTNFTSDRFHPSWFSQITFGPKEPTLETAETFGWTKP